MCTQSRPRLLLHLWGFAISEALVQVPLMSPGTECLLKVKHMLKGFAAGDECSRAVRCPVCLSLQNECLKPNSDIEKCCSIDFSQRHHEEIGEKAAGSCSNQRGPPL